MYSNNVPGREGTHGCCVCTGIIDGNWILDIAKNNLFADPLNCFFHLKFSFLFCNNNIALDPSEGGLI